MYVKETTTISHSFLNFLNFFHVPASATKKRLIDEQALASRRPGRQINTTFDPVIVFEKGLCLLWSYLVLR
jgi:hypothetical protein